ncbi:MAG: hypothetical protein HY077_07445 [Elusimicrobia bacterium]|nr:hypothetical protein [Elusimicrobiota bacterium]
MKNAVSKPWKSLALGALSGALVFCALRVVMADPQSITVAQLHTNARAYVGTVATVTGLAYYIKPETRMKNGQSVPYTKLSVYEVDAKNKKGKYYVYVAIPTSEFKFMPAEGDSVAITGKIDWPKQVAEIAE